MKKIIWVFILVILGCETNKEETIQTQDVQNQDVLSEELIEEDILPEDIMETIEDEKAEEISVLPEKCVEDLSDLSEDEVYGKIYFQEVPVVIYLYVSWCGYCRLYRAEFEKVCQWKREENVAVKFYKVDAEKVQIDFDLRTYPVTFFFCNGNEPMFYEAGYRKAEDLNDTVDYFLEQCE